MDATALKKRVLTAYYRRFIKTGDITVNIDLAERKIRLIEDNEFLALYNIKYNATGGCKLELLACGRHAKVKDCRTIWKLPLPKD